jgi:hypothetical protein
MNIAFDLCQKKRSTLVNEGDGNEIDSQNQRNKNKIIIQAKPKFNIQHYTSSESLKSG